MDFRLNDEVDKWIKESKLLKGGFDLISVAGASKILADDNQSEIDYFLKNVTVSFELHQVQKIILFHHSDCGAYAQSYSFNSLEKEKKKQLEDMRKVKKMLEHEYPGVEVILVWGELKDKNGEEIEFEIVE